MVTITERYYCHDASTICLSTLLPAIKLTLLVTFACKMLGMVAGLLQSIMHTWSVSTSCQNTLFKPKMFFYCMVVLK